MPRFSAKVKDIFVSLSYHTDIIKANRLLEELKDPLDIAFGKLFISIYYLGVEQLGKFLELLTEIEIENKRFKDQFLQFLINSCYCRYYTGINNPISK